MPLGAVGGVEEDELVVGGLNHALVNGTQADYLVVGYVKMPECAPESATPTGHYCITVGYRQHFFRMVP